MLRKAIKLAVVLAFAACMLISCTPEPSGKPDSGSMGYASFSKQSRDLSTSYETALYSGLYWFYDSEKADPYGKTGEAENAKVPGRLDVNPSDPNYAKGLNGLVGPFSMGSWNFTLKAYSSASNESGTWVPDQRTLVYMGSANNVIIRDGETKYVPVSVAPQGDNGTIIFENAYFRWKDPNGEYAPAHARLDLYEGSNLAHTIELNVASSKDAGGRYAITNTPVSIPAKYYKAVAVAQIDLADGTKSEVATEAFSLRVYGNAKTKVYGNLYESVFSKVYFEAAEQDMAVFTPSGDAEISVKPTPATSIVADPTKNTTVKFPAGTLQNNATYQLDVQVVASVSANSKYGISGVNEYRKSSYAGLDIKLYLVTIEADGTVRQTPVTQFNSPVEVSTFIEKGLSSVTVHYNGVGDGPTDVVYNGDTGKLTFKASHFSEYYVMAEACAINETKNIGYPTLAKAVENAS
ncbi:MAG: hypothetical protein SPJ34_03450, partial [Candidatus Ornithospirochaeta sp.]|nr:hypothetical protein [Candidatus Ornithospirochaeta sp.]